MIRTAAISSSHAPAFTSWTSTVWTLKACAYIPWQSCGGAQQTTQ
ncbi:hypothetical protein [Candidatus Protochlamydia naegleriophila]|nr:hypothetical protein [Candidatus Protochlamydia naegleriophila]